MFTIPAISILISSLLCPTAYATTISEILAGILDARKPASLNTLAFVGDLTLHIDESGGGLLPEGAALQAAWLAPDNWLCTYELSNEPVSGIWDVGGMGASHPAVDQVFLSRPDFIDILNIDWSVQFQGTAMWDGEAAWKLQFSPSDLADPTPPFRLYVRKDDFFPLRAEVELPDGTSGITDLTWITIENVVVPAAFTTTFNPPIGPLSGYETAWFNHEINPDLSGFEFSRAQGSLQTGDDPAGDDGPAVFEELYHGFADDPIVAPLNDSSGTYDRLSFTFTLYVEDRDIFRQLENRQDEIRNLAIDIVSQWEWSGDDGLGRPGGKYECGKDIRDAIGELLGTSTITDFYFLDFEPLQSGEDD